MLLHLYHTTGGGSWKYQTGWAENAENLGSWYGVTTNGDDRVVKLELQGNYRDLRFTGNNVVGETRAEGSRDASQSSKHTSSIHSSH